MDRLGGAYGDFMGENIRVHKVDHQFKPPAQADLVASAEFAEMLVVRQADPVVVSTGEIREPVLARETTGEGVDLDKELGRHIDDLESQSVYLFDIQVVHFFEHFVDNTDRPEMSTREGENRQIRVPVVNQNVRVGKENRGAFRHLFVPLASTSSHFVE